MQACATHARTRQYPGSTQRGEWSTASRSRNPRTPIDPGHYRAHTQDAGAAARTSLPPERGAYYVKHADT